MSLADMPPGVTSRKVAAATGGAGAGTVIALFIVGMLDDHVYVDGDVPGYISGLIVFMVPVGLTWLAGYRARRGVDELLPPQRPGQHVRRVDDVDESDVGDEDHAGDDEAGSTRLTDAIVAVVVLFIVVCFVLAVLGAMRS